MIISKALFKLIRKVLLSEKFIKAWHYNIGKYSVIQKILYNNLIEYPVCQKIFNESF